MTDKDELIGKTIGGDFTVQERIGSGGMAVVYRAHQTSVNRDVALKVIHFTEENAFKDEHFRQRFANEAKYIASLEHIHILPVHAYGIEGDIAYLAMRLLRGGSIKELVADEKPLQIEQAALFFEQITRGLAYAHSKGIIHRDLKPANILLDDNHNAYLTDFGLAKLSDAEVDLTREDNIVGTLWYMSPEQLRGDKLDNRADIYSMGILLYQLVCGRVPFKNEGGEDMIAVMYKHLEQEAQPPRELNPNISPELEAAILKAMEKAPEDRYQDIQEMARDVRDASGLTASSTFAFPRYKLRDRRNWHFLSLANLQTAFVALVAIALVLVALLVFTRPQPIPDHVVLEGEVALWNELEPSDEQIERAQRKLGEEGFVAILPCSQASAYHARLVREISERFREYSLAFEVYDANSQAYDQVVLLERALADGAKSILICPLDIELLRPTLLDIEEQIVPVVTQGGAGDSITGVYTSGEDDEYEMGLIAGQYAGQFIRDELDGQADVIVLDFPDMDTIVQRANGLEDGVLEFAPDANIVGRYLGATSDNGYETVHELLEGGTRFDVIVSINDAGAFGAVRAMEEAGILPEDVAIIGIDAEQQAVQYIQEGYYFQASLSLQEGRSANAIGMVDIMTRMLAGETVPQVAKVPPGGMLTRESLQNAPDEQS